MHVRHLMRHFSNKLGILRLKPGILKSTWVNKEPSWPEFLSWEIFSLSVVDALFWQLFMLIRNVEKNKLPFLTYWQLKKGEGKLKLAVKLPFWYVLANLYTDTPVWPLVWFSFNVALTVSSMQQASPWSDLILASIVKCFEICKWKVPWKV